MSKIYIGKSGHPGCPKSVEEQTSRTSKINIGVSGHPGRPKFIWA